MAQNNNLRSAIVTVCGHVDHGKTSLLDKIRGSSVASGESGGITQKISFTTLTAETINQRAQSVLDKFKIPLEIPGFLLIDTPGHAAFTNLRKRGGSLADIAVLVIDINEGLKPQTIETIQILKQNKTPFIVALNKIDNISGWQSTENGYFFENFEKQALRIKQEFDEKLYTIIGALNAHGFNSEVYTKITDFTKNLVLVPCSARTGEGISEIIALLVALSQKFLKNRISIKQEARGVILEVKKEKSINFLESILYDGSLKVNDEIIIASFGKPIITKIRSMQEALPLSKGFRAVESVNAAAGIRLQTTTKEEIVSGMPFQIVGKDIKEVEKEFSKDVQENIQLDKDGIYVKAESLGSLEALLFLLHQKQIKVIKAEIGNITKKDIAYAESLPEQDKVLLAFNVEFDEESKDQPLKDVTVIKNDIVYKLIEDFEEARAEKQKKIERAKLSKLPSLAKLTILQYVFHNSNPAIFGVKIEAGVLKQEIELINRSGEKIGRVKAIQHEKKSLHEAEKSKEVAISMPGVNFERQLKQGETLYSNMNDMQFRKFKDNKSLLTQDEIRTLQEIAEIKRKQDLTWGV